MGPFVLSAIFVRIVLDLWKSHPCVAVCTQAFRGSWHPALLVSKKVPTTYGDFFFLQKYPRFWNLKLDFFPFKNSFLQIFENTPNFFHLNFISKKKLKKSGNLFFAEKSACYLWGFWFFFQKYPRFWNLKLDFFPFRKISAIFSKIRQFFFTWTLFQKKKKTENLFRSVGQELIITTRFSRLLSGEGCRS